MATMSEQAAEQQPLTFARERLAPGMYSLDLSRVAQLAVEANGEKCTFIDVLRRLHNEKITDIQHGFFDHETYVTEGGPVAVKVADHQHWLLRLLKTFVELVRKGVDLDSAQWFYYDHDWSRDADEMHCFFVVSDGKIVDESCAFFADEPLVLQRKHDKEPIWHSHPSFDQAWERLCYRKFYTETIQGQLMVLRPDEPIVYHYDRPNRTDPARAVEFVTLIRIYHLLWVTIPLLVAAAFPSIAVYMAALAGIFMVDVLWKCWVTRNVGREP